jgi:RimJ/RimL family protein N-acetyltransferase
MAAPVAAATLDTPRLLLRTFTDADWGPYAAICADGEVMRHVGNGQAQKPEEAWRSMAMFLGHWQLRGYGMWALVQRDDGRLLGRVGFHHPPDWPDFELGWLLGREYWGHGYAREAATVALNHAFAALKRERVISLIRPDNQRSIAVAEAIGERLHGRVELFGSDALVYEARP